MNLTSWSNLVKAAITSWIADFAPSMGAALAYYTVFSIAPLLIIVIAVAALVFGQDVAQQGILDQARGLLGDESAAAIETMLANAQRPKQGALAGVLSAITLLVGATTVFAELESDLNRIWKVTPQKASGLWHFIRTRILSIGMILAIGFLLLVSLIVSAALAAWGKYWGSLFGEMEVLLQIANFVVSIGVITVLFAILYKLLPQTPIRWRDVWVGAAVTALLFAFGKFLIGMYIGRSGVASAYGAAGTLVVLLVWVYYSAQIFLLGAEFTRAYAVAHGSLRTQQPARGPVDVGTAEPVRAAK
jgi:membrane protein